MNNPTPNRSNGTDALACKRCSRPHSFTSTRLTPAFFKALTSETARTLGDLFHTLAVELEVQGR